MVASARPPRRVGLRSGVATVEIMTGATVAHGWAGGALPSVPWLVGLVGLVFAASLAVLRRRVGLWLMVTVLGSAQFVLHGFLTWMAPTGHAHVAHAHVDGPVLGLTWQMVAAHAASAVLTAVVWAVRRRAVEMALTWVDLAPAPLPAATAPVVPAMDAVAWLRRWLAVAHRRGPPARLVCA
jgi:hypothetical protein